MLLMVQTTERHKILWHIEVGIGKTVSESFALNPQQLPSAQPSKNFAAVGNNCKILAIIALHALCKTFAYERETS